MWQILVLVLFRGSTWPEVLILYCIGVKTGSHIAADSALLEMHCLSWACHVVGYLLVENGSW